MATNVTEHALSKPEFQIAVERDLPAQMHDGVRLYADVYRPKSEGKFPVIVIRTPYEKRGGIGVGEDYGEYFAKRGYVVVIQDVRGLYKSEGEFYFLAHEAVDGFQTIEWAAGLPWSNGRVGTAGQSYYAYTQYLLAPTRPPHLRTMVPISGASDFHEGSVYRTGGALLLAGQLGRILGVGREAARRKGKGEDYFAWLATLPATDGRGLKEEWYRHLPLKDWADWCGDVVPHLRDHILNPDAGPLWWQVSIRRQHSMIATPMLHISSWYDCFLEGALNNFMGIQRFGLTPEARQSQKLFVGPWAHIAPYTKPTTKAGEIDFGPDAAVQIHDLEVRWFDYWLKGIANGIMGEPKVRIFVMGANRWRDEQDWPLPNTQHVKHHLHSNGRANTLHGDGTLNPTPAAQEQPDRFTYDPEHPVPTHGGAILGLPSGGYDQRPLEAREDVLVYTSAPLEHDTEVTGHVTVELYAATTAPDTDFTAKLVDVRPDGYALNLCDGIVRARYRESRLTPSLIEPGKVYRYTIDLLATSNLFKKGHRIRLEISSSSFPQFDRNPNTGRPIHAETQPVKAAQSIFHDRQFPSCLVLPVVQPG